jgi:hypothetical protein
MVNRTSRLSRMSNRRMLMACVVRLADLTQTEQAAAARRMLAIKQQELALMEDHLRLQLELHRRRQHQA